MTTTNKQTVQILVDLCAQKGIKRVVVSPGSRNAPLSIAFNRDPRIECYVIVDERSAAFFALGLSQKSGEAVAIVCTSGTALLNYAPAVAEAFYQRIPLVVLSADRPTEWIEQDDSQAINQQQVFANFTKFSCQIPTEITCEDEAWHVNRTVNEALNYATSGRKGPVHINIPLREPLYGIVEKTNSAQRTFDQFEPESFLSKETISDLKSRLPQSPKIMILASFLPNEMKEKINAAISRIEKISNVVVLAEPISNIQTANAITTIDRTLNKIQSEEAPDFAPDVLISFGGSLVSKQIKTFIKNNPPKEHWYIGKGETHIDTFRQLTALIQLEPAAFLEQFFAENAFGESEYAKLWQRKEKISAERHSDYMNIAPWSDLKAFEIICKATPEGSDLQLGNSSAVRYGHLFSQRHLGSVQSNRGTSGIDGSTSTAVGAAWISEEITTLISGDISFFYDSNALWNKYLSPNLRIFVMKNGGGSLFRFIPGPSSVEELDDYFEAAQELNIEKVANLYNLPFYRSNNAEELAAILPKIYESHDKPVIIEVNTPRLENDKVLKAYFSAIRG
ncbi:MAG: 2-succinyl-5-enolpyruvyl-6-hydroxy-3-cyclohexene-1-carboxylic-acid synthase [Bacteroidales bacterium]|nr:2-succinyl-5-enolpyruvyl-6-hydroxy-3-cyclohexene-1-carboxylic-acid synthase [Bacteroidales bacterium]